MPIGLISEDADRAQRFRATALPYLDDVYTVARYLMRSAADADDAVQECYLRAYRHFDTFRGGPIKPWLLAILRNVCRKEFGRRASGAVSATSSTGPDMDMPEDAMPLWQDIPDTAEAGLLRRQD